MLRVVDVMGAMMDRRITWFLLIGVVLLSNACVVTREEFDGLQRNVKNLRGEVSTMKGEPVGVEGGTFRRTDTVARLEELAAETRMIQGQIEENSYRLSEISQRLDQTEMKVARLLGEPVRPGRASPGIPSAAVPPSVPGGAPPSPRLPAAPGPGQPGMQGSVPSPEKVYKDALTDYTKGNYDLAIKGFRTYLTYFPKTSLVPNAQYWLAESYYSQRKYPDAIREFDKLVKTYPDSTRVPSAMLKQGYAYLELGEKPLGQGVLRELVAKYPRSREARLAQDTLEQSR